MANERSAAIGSAALLVGSMFLVGCDPKEQPTEHTEEAKDAVFVNGQFETGAANTAPPSWTVTSYINPGITVQTPQTRAGLNLAAGGLGRTWTLESLTGPETQIDPDLGVGASLRWPKFGNKVAQVNGQASGTGGNQNVNSLKQTMTIAAGDLDSLDGLPHVRFVVAPVLQNPAHNPNEQPYYFVQLRNITQGNQILYADFNLSAQAGVPWKTVGNIFYTDWQLVDISPGNANLAVGDQVELEVIAAGCSLGAHWGHIYVDSASAQVPGIFVTGTGPQAANAGTNITYNLVYQNGGVVPAAGVHVYFNIPANTTFQAIQPNGLVCVTPPVGMGGLVDCTVGALAGSANGNFQVTVNINAGAMGQIVAGNYYIQGTLINPLLGPKIVTNITNGVSFANLSITKDDGVTNVVQGQQVTYTIVAKNDGPDAVVGATVTDNFPASLTGVSWTCTASAGSSCSAPSGSGNINTQVSLLNQGTATFTATATVAGNATGSINNVANIAVPGGAQDPVANNNGEADQDFVDPCPDLNQPCTVGVGACQAVGVKTTCLNNAGVCNAVAGNPTPDVCDGIDNNCDGATDENNPGGNLPCATGLFGVCSAGTTACQAGSVKCVQNVPSSAEICDAADNNCDGQVDEGFNVGSVCTNGVGACQSAGLIVCNAGAAMCNAVAGQPSQEVCDAVDNDCNGLTDEGFNVGTACSAGEGACKNSGTIVCVAGAGQCSAVPGVPTPEVCDTVDNNCDGQTDEGFNVGQACTKGLGICQGAGTFACSNGAAVCDAVTGEPAEEICGDQLDSDCDGQLNNGCVDSDGDGLYDTVEILIGTDPNDADSDDDGVIDGDETFPAEDSDGDGLINALDPDSDDDGLKDGTELGLDCSNPATDVNAGHCVPDADGGATTTDPLDADTDDGGVSDGSEDSNLNGQIDAGETDPTSGHGADDTDAANMDSDGDGLSDNLEETLGSDPNDADTDDDGVPDGLEPNPSEDTDGDGLINILDVDSDNDGLYDGTELGLDCSNPDTDTTKNHCIADGDNGATRTSPLDPDTDDGGVTDGSEDINKNGVVDGTETDPTSGNGNDDDSAVNEDSDGDGLTDAFEDAIGSDKNDADSDDDGVIDGQEPNLADDTDGDGKINVLDPDSDNDGLFDGTELGLDCENPATDPLASSCIADGDNGATKTSPLDPDTDNGGVNDGDEDLDHDGVVDAGETDPTTGHGADDDLDKDDDGLPDAIEDANQNGVVDPGETDPNNPDTDGDGQPDGIEDANHNGTVDAGETDPLNPDTDGDGLLDGQEDTNGNGKVDPKETDPLNPDTDGGGIDDGTEVGRGTDPLNPADDIEQVKPDEVLAQGDGILCSASPVGAPSGGSMPLAPLALLTLGALRLIRRKRAA